MASRRGGGGSMEPPPGGGARGRIMPTFPPPMIEENERESGCQSAVESVERWRSGEVADAQSDEAVSLGIQTLSRVDTGFDFSLRLAASETVRASGLDRSGPSVRAIVRPGADGRHDIDHYGREEEARYGGEYISLPRSNLAGFGLLHAHYLVAVEETKGIEGLFDLFGRVGGVSRASPVDTCAKAVK